MYLKNYIKDIFMIFHINSFPRDLSPRWSKYVRPFTIWQSSHHALALTKARFVEKGT